MRFGPIVPLCIHTLYVLKSLYFSFSEFFTHTSNWASYLKLRMNTNFAGHCSPFAANSFCKVASTLGKIPRLFIDKLRVCTEFCADVKTASINAISESNNSGNLRIMVIEGYLYKGT